MITFIFSVIAFFLGRHIGAKLERIKFALEVRKRVDSYLKGSPDNYLYTPWAVEHFVIKATE